MMEQSEMQNMAKSELATKIHILQSELNQAQLTYESQIKSLKSENERELSQMYSRWIIYVIFTYYKKCRISLADK